MTAYVFVIASFVLASVGPVCSLLLVPEQNFDQSSARDAAEASVWPIFQASPKNEYGRLENDVVALALQRHFARKRGWRVEVDNAELLGRIGKLNAGGRGFSIRDLIQAVDAVEDLVSAWILEGLARTFEANNASTEEVFGAEELKKLLEAYAESVVLPSASAALPPPATSAMALHLVFERQRRLSGNSFTPDQFSFNDAVSMAGDFMKQLERQRHEICARQSLPQSTCFARGEHYAICCHSLYEAVMSQLERKLQAQFVAPELLIRTVSGVSLKSMGLRYCPSKSLERQLHSIAEQNDGTVTLHGQDFSAWLPHAFQKDCASSDQQRVDLGVRWLVQRVGCQDLARVAVAGLIGFAMLRSVLSHLQVANGALRGRSEKQKF